MVRGSWIMREWGAEAVGCSGYRGCRMYEYWRVLSSPSHSALFDHASFDFRSTSRSYSTFDVRPGQMDAYGQMITGAAAAGFDRSSPAGRVCGPSGEGVNMVMVMVSWEGERGMTMRA